MPKTTAHPDWEALAPAVLAGDDAAFAELLLKLHRYAIKCAERYATRRGGGCPEECERDPEDMASVALCHVVKHARRYDPKRGASFSSWLILVVVSSIRQQVRRRTIRQIPKASLTDELAVCLAARPESDPWDADDARYRVGRLLRPLPAKYRRIILRHAAGETAAAIARSMGVSNSYVSQVIRQSHAKLRAAARAGKAGVKA